MMRLGPQTAGGAREETSTGGPDKGGPESQPRNPDSWGNRIATDIQGLSGAIKAPAGIQALAVARVDRSPVGTARSHPQLVLRWPEIETWLAVQQAACGPCEQHGIEHRAVFERCPA